MNKRTRYGLINTLNAAEGWGIFRVMGPQPTLQLQRIDPSDINGNTARFASDDEAIEFVVSMARVGSPRHRRFLRQLALMAPDEFAYISKLTGYPDQFTPNRHEGL